MSISPAGSLSTIHCYFCGGAGCKYENWKLWVGQGTNAFDGLYSNWITNNVLAMQRPSTRLMREYNLIRKFKEAGIGAIFNLQQPGEHMACGDGLDPGSDFSYVPEVWMESGISYLQYGWVDMDIPHCELILGAVQLMSFLIGSGKKVAVHCHAGLGRTGLLIASYLIFDKQMTPIEAQQLVRLARPGSIQNKKQTAFLDVFRTYLTKLRFYYPQMMMSGMISTPSQTFLDILQNQSICLHGKEQRKLRWVPKPVYLISKRLKELFQIQENRVIIIDEIEHLDYHVNSEEFTKMQSKINCGEWSMIETLDIKLLVQLLLIFFLSIKESLIDGEFISFLENDTSKLRKSVVLHQRLDLGILTTICVIMDIFKIGDNGKSLENSLDLVFIQFAGIFSPERPSWISKDTLQVSTLGVNAMNLNLKLPPMPKFFQDWTGLGKSQRRKMSVPVWNVYETLQYIYNTYHIKEDEMSLVPVDEEAGESIGISESIASDSISEVDSEDYNGKHDHISGGEEAQNSAAPQDGPKLDSLEIPDQLIKKQSPTSSDSEVYIEAKQNPSTESVPAFDLPGPSTSENICSTMEPDTENIASEIATSDLIHPEKEIDNSNADLEAIVPILNTAIKIESHEKNEDTSLETEIEESVVPVLFDETSK